MINCPSCGGVLKYDIASAQMKCASCDSLFDPYIFDKTKADAESHGTYDARVFVCPGCGARLETADDTDVTSVCAYCGHPRIIFDRIEKLKRPDKIVPFRVTKEDCIKKYVRASRRAFLSPGKLRSPGTVESFRGIYMPYWSYKAEVDGRVIFRYIGQKSRSGDYIVQNNYKKDVRVKASFSDVIHDASRMFDDSVSESLGVFGSENETPFTPGYLCGFYADAWDVPSDEYLKDVKKKMDRRLYLAAKDHVDTNMTEEEDKTVYPGKKVKPIRTMDPVWFMSIRKNDKVNYAAVNGATGKLVADFPISPVKFFIFAFLIAAATFVTLTFGGLILRPVTALLLSCILATVAWALNAAQYSKLVQKGLITPKEKTDGEQSGSEKIKSRAGSTNHKGAVGCFVTMIIFVVVGFLLKNSKSLLSGLSAVFNSIPIFKNALDLISFFVMISALVFSIVFYRKLKKRGGNAPTPFFVLLATEVISGTVIFIRPVNEVYYIISFVNAAVFAVQAVITFRHHNCFAYRRPPQFNKKGGDDNA